MFSPYLLKKYEEIFDEKTIEGLKRPLKQAIRVNTLKISESMLVRRLENRGFKLEKITFVRCGYFVKKAPFSISATPEYLLGYYFIQDPASMYACEALDPKPGQVILDMASAPGGKTTYLAQLLGSSGTVISTEINKGRIKSLTSNIQRMGLKNVITIRMDANFVGGIGIKFERVLLDAPCTGTGTIFKNPEAARKDEKDVANCIALQRPLLKAGLEVLKKKGTMVYSTCSLLPEENEFIAEEAILQGAKIMNVEYGEEAFTRIYGKELPIEMKKAKRFYPHIHGTQGFFICKIQR